MTGRIMLLVAAVFIVVLIAMNPLAGSPEFAGAAEVVPSAVQVPEAINNAIAVGIAALLSLGFAWLFAKTGLDLTGFATPLAITISAFVVAELQNIINMIPESYDPTVDFVFKVIVLLLGSVGLLVFRARPSQPNSLLL